MKKAFELVPILAAAAIGAIGAYLLFGDMSSTTQDANGNVHQTVADPYMAPLKGAAIGAAIQIGVRLLGVS